NPHMHLRFLIALASSLIAPAVFAQSNNAPTVDELVSKNVEAKGGANALQTLQSLRLTGKLLVNQGQIELAYLETKKRPDEVRTERSEERRVGKSEDKGGRRKDRKESGDSSGAW